ncbi:ABC-2 type transporter [Colletotrichum salicis]|uniref:ABC-2 type transporter n=1 Tax=Colletotrichum salicis TaxID=1209931 RepID=A0A135TW24_9PEZI|nr:ABC-2 type transporter [Colletotrichum salicis]
MTLYAKRKIVEKHARYALYHPSAEALSAMIVNLPYKIVNAILMNYHFSVAQALAPASIILLLIALYTGFAIPPQYMQDWLGWARWLNPVYYGLESVMLNEFIGRDFHCSTFVPMGPGYDSVAANERVCSTAGSVPDQDFVGGTAYLSTSYGFENSHRWRNVGVLIAYMILFMGLHLFATEYIASERSKGEVLVFSRKAMSKRRKPGAVDVETGAPAAGAQQRSEDDSEGVAGMEKQTSVFHWKDVCYDIKIKGEPRRILDHVDGWVKPGTLTAPMRKTGYVQQQDLHLHTSTVREALNFSALLRRPAGQLHPQGKARVCRLAGGIVNLFAIMMFAFCGILAGPNDLPKVLDVHVPRQPLYLRGGRLPGHIPRQRRGALRFQRVRLLCGAERANVAGSSWPATSPLPAATSQTRMPLTGTEKCQYCAMSDTNTFLKGINVDFDHRWRNFGLVWAYCIFNIVVAALVYWLVRMPKNKKVKKE